MFFGFPFASGMPVHKKEEKPLGLAITHTLLGRQLTISIDTLTGAPAPSVALAALTLEGVDVLGDVVGSGPWFYEVPSSPSSSSIAWSVIATNGVASDATADGSEIVPADLIAPAFTTHASISPASGPVGTQFTLGEGVATGDPAPYLTGMLTLDGVDVTPAGLTYVSHGAGALVWTVTAANGIGSDSVSVATAAVEAEALIAPSFDALPSGALSARRLTISTGTASGSPAPAVALATLTLDGIDVLDGATGSGPWVYPVPSSSSAQTVAWMVAATNVEGSASVSGAEIVAADIVTPAAFAAVEWILADNPSEGGDELTLTVLSVPSDGGAAITALQYRVDSGSGYGAAQTLSGTGIGPRNIAVLAETETNVQLRALNAVGEGDWSDAKTATPSSMASETVPEQMVTPEISGGEGTLTVTLASTTHDGGTPITGYNVQIQVAGEQFDQAPAYATASVGLGTPMSYAVFDGATCYTNATAAAANSTSTETSGNAVDFSVFIDAEFPATLSTDICFFQVAARHRFRVLSDGSISVNMDDTLSAEIIRAVANCDVRGGRHRIGITANSGDGVSLLPAVTITVDGVVQSLSTDDRAYGNGLFHMSRKPYTLLAESIGTVFGNFVPDTVQVYQVAVWTNQNGAADHDWTTLDTENLDASVIGAPLLYLGGDFTTTALEAAYSGSLPFTLEGTAPTITSASVPSVVFADLPANHYTARSCAVNAIGAGAWSNSTPLVAVTEAVKSATAITVAQGDWIEIDLFEIAPAFGSVDYILKEGAVPPGMAFMPGAGLLHGVPSTSGATSLVFERVVGSEVVDVPVDVIVASGAGGDTTPRAFTTAVGFGRFATGGRGQRVYRATNLSASAATSGSLPWALAQAKANGGGYILAEVEGALELGGTLFVTGGENITIDARRAPGTGFTIMGAHIVWDNCNNVVMRGVNCFPASNFVGSDQSNRDGFEVRRSTAGTSENFYFHEIVVGASIDEGISTWASAAGQTVRGITFDRVMVAETCHANMHFDSPGSLVHDEHGKALLFSSAGTGSLGRSTDITMHRTAIVSNHERNPRMLNCRAEMVNCIVANIRNGVGMQIVAGSELSVINTAWLAGPSGPTNDTRLNDSGSPVWETGSWYGPFGGRTFPNGWSNSGNVTAGLRDAADVSQVEWPGLLAADQLIADLSNWLGWVRHPFFRRVVNYLTESTPFTTGWHGAGYPDNFIPDELRAIGATVGVSSSDLTVTLPDAATALPLPAGSSWAGVQVSVIDAYDNTVETNDTPKRGENVSNWSTAVGPLSGSLAGGDVDFNNLPAGYYVVEAVYTLASGTEVKLYTGRPVAVA